MPEKSRDYFRYFTVTRDGGTWGLDVTSSGFSSVPAGSRYPTAQHPADHHFDWEHGRVLEALQIVFLIRGRGTFESRESGVLPVSAGAAMCLLPGVWHRYRPDPEVGWDESWVEVQGPLVDKLISAQVFDRLQPVRSGVVATGIEVALEMVHSHSRTGAPGFDALRAAAAFSVLAACHQAGKVWPPRSQLDRAVVEAERYLAEHHAAPLNVADVARRLGVAYSHFRRAFREHTGFAPWQYVIHLRLSRARRLLAAGDATLDDIAAQIGFSSAFHLSAAFKRAYGVSPAHWRRDLVRGVSFSR